MSRHWLERYMQQGSVSHTVEFHFHKLYYMGILIKSTKAHVVGLRQ